jgi:coenzyme Q-binding protein COQ10
MPQFRTSRRVAHSAKQMFDLVAKVEDYPAFVPLCTGLRVRKRTPVGAGEMLLADMEVGYRAIREKFTSKVTCDSDTNTIHVEYVDGPFRRLVNHWHFVDGPDEGASSVEFYIDYEFRSRALALVMGAVFDRAFRQFADAFEARADAVYGTASKP